MTFGGPYPLPEENLPSVQSEYFEGNRMSDVLGEAHKVSDVFGGIRWETVRVPGKVNKGTARHLVNDTGILGLTRKYLEWRDSLVGL